MSEKTRQATKVQYPPHILELRDAFVEAVENGGRWDWQAAQVALELRAAFPQRAGKDQLSWGEFCEDALGWHGKTISSFIRAARYCAEARVPGWPTTIAGLPPTYLVAELASRKPSPERDALHNVLFSGEFGSVGAYRKALAELREAEQEDEPVGTGTQKSNSSKDASERSTGAEQLKPGGKSNQPVKDSHEAPGVWEESKEPGGNADPDQDQTEPSAELHPFWAALRDHGALSEQGADRLAGMARDRQVQLFGQVCERAEVDVLTSDEIDEGLAGVFKEAIASLLGLADPEEQVTPATPGPTAPQSGAKGDITPPFTPPSAEVVIGGSGSLLEVSEAEWRNEIATAMADERAFVSHLKRGLLIQMKEDAK